MDFNRQDRLRRKPEKDYGGRKTYKRQGKVIEALRKISNN